jgi:hypothetical protein
VGADDEIKEFIFEGKRLSGADVMDYPGFLGKMFLGRALVAVNAAIVIWHEIDYIIGPVEGHGPTANIENAISRRKSL